MDSLRTSEKVSISNVPKSFVLPFFLKYYIQIASAVPKTLETMH